MKRFLNLFLLLSKLLKLFSCFTILTGVQSASMLQITMELEILGSGTSHGVPVVGCTCPVCTSQNPKDNRMRTSALIRLDDGKACIIDVGPEFRIQALRAGITTLEAAFITHSHADHLHGLDDLRIFTRKQPLPIWAERSCLRDIRSRFSYAFHKTPKGGGKPHFRLCPVSVREKRIPVCDPAIITVAGANFQPVPVFHGSLMIFGWRIGDTAYITDCNRIPNYSFRLLAGVKNLVIGALRLREHSTHFSFPQAVAAIDRIGVENAWFTHICHDFSHEQIQAWLRENAPGKKIEPAYDGLRITIQGTT